MNDQQEQPRHWVDTLATLVQDALATIGVIAIIAFVAASQCCFQTYDAETGEVHIMGRCSSDSKPLKDTCKHVLEGDKPAAQTLAEESPGSELYIDAEYNKSE